MRSIEIGIVGSKNSGKTTLIEELTRELTRRGYGVATIKHTSHRHSFDKENKDTFRHRKAGSGMTLAISGSELALFSENSSENVRILRDAILSTSDICLVEGDREADRPKVLLTRKIEDTDITALGGVIATYGPSGTLKDLAHFKLDDIQNLAAFIQKGYLSSHTENPHA